METWITAALSADVQRLRSSYAGVLVFPRWFFTSNSLMKLELKLCKIKILMNISYSNLRILGFHDVEFQNDDPSSPLFLTFPVIEEFLSLDCKWRNVKKLKIEAPRLARFEMTGCIFEHANDGSNDCKIEIRGSNRAKFKCSVDIFASFYFSSQSKLVDASLEYWKPDMNDDINQRSKTGFQACMILTRSSAFIRFLELSTDLIQVLADANPRCPSNFFRLARLKVYSASIAIQCDAALINFMKMAPGLESLTFTGEFSRQAAGDYDQIQLLPGYLSFLEVVKLEYSCSPKPTESTLVKFILRNAVKLKELLIYSQHEGHKVDEVRDHLFKCSRGSRNVSILSL
ncbi:putative F-box/FBD/LRR-repeat protein At1g66290 [Coffea arabica]|uniref:F-box/FBD/LRR-repeat protein At1g66290 n=1 Tax=Coffea arabica TaxID=13443 RepID=A0ABM4UBV2_COFAR